MILEAAGKTYAVHFHHHEVIVDNKTFKTYRDVKELLDDHGVKSNDPLRFIHRRTTSATIHEGKCVEKKRPCTMKDAVTATAQCSIKDHFERLKGRKLALGRVLVKAGLPKQVRTELWRSFRSQLKRTDEGFLAYEPRSIDEVLHEANNPGTAGSIDGPEEGVA